MNKQKEKNKKYIKVVLVIFIILGVSSLFYVKYFSKFFGSKITNYVCETIHKGRNMGGECHVKDGKSIKENIYNLHFKIPKQRNLFLAKWKKEGSIVINEEIKDQVIVELYIEKINKYSSGSEFTMPFKIKYENGEEETYLGFFGLFDIYKHGPDYKFYKSIIRHADSFLLGKNIEIEDIKNGKSGVYDDGYYESSNHLVIQEYYEKGSGDKKELRIRIYKDEGEMRLDGECDQLDTLITRKRGDGEVYKVCVSKNGGECELETYERGSCPLNGFNVREFNEKESYCYITGNMPRKNDGTCYVIVKNSECLFEDYFNGKCD